MQPLLIYFCLKALHLDFIIIRQNLAVELEVMLCTCQRHAAAERIKLHLAAEALLPLSAYIKQRQLA